MKKLSLVFVALFMGSVAWGKQTQTQAMLNIRSVNGVVSNYPYQLKVPNSSLTDNADGTMTLSVLISTSVLQSGTTIYASSATIVTFYSSTATITNLVGTTTNGNAAPGSYGEYRSSVTASVTPFPTSNTFGDILSLSLTAGDWDVTAIGKLTGSGGASTTELEFALTTTAGNDGTGIVGGDNDWHDVFAATINGSRNGVVPNVRFSLSATTTVYFKYYALYTVATPVIQGRMSARRVR